MRKQNWRLVIFGLVLIVLSVVFYFVMLGMAPRSTDATELMSTVGTVSGVVAGLSVALIVFGFIGKKV